MALDFDSTPPPSTAEERALHRVKHALGTVRTILGDIRANAEMLRGGGDAVKAAEKTQDIKAADVLKVFDAVDSAF